MASDNRIIMSDSHMATQRISIRIPRPLGDKLKKQSASKGRSPSELVREALETYLASANEAPSAYELAEQAGLIGILRHAPRDLSTNKRHLKDFGKSSR
jgi:metal-responsive CopG/Arc/MetJ family transcriptional regulator